MIRATSLAFVMVAALTARSASAQSRDDAAVFNATLARFAADFQRTQKLEPKFLVLNQTTVMLPEDLGYTPKYASRQLLDELLTNNAVPQSLASYSPLPPFHLSSARSLGSALEVAKPGLARPHYYRWDLLHAQFPESVGILELAFPVYAPDHSSALVYFWTGCGTMCASGYIYALEQSHGIWTVVHTYTPWIV
jgi:hypothetical protein